MEALYLFLILSCFLCFIVSAVSANEDEPETKPEHKYKHLPKEYIKDILPYLICYSDIETTKKEEAIDAIIITNAQLLQAESDGYTVFWDTSKNVYIGMK